MKDLSVCAEDSDILAFFKEEERRLAQDLLSIQNWDVSNVTDFSNMFKNCYDYNPQIF
jgi:hypothetical protein